MNRHCDKPCGAPAAYHRESNESSGAADRWLIQSLLHVDVDLELRSNEAVKRVVALGLGLGCLSRHTVVDAIGQGWLVEVKAPLPQMRCTLSIVLHRSKRLGSVSQDFLRHCQQPQTAL